MAIDPKIYGRDLACLDDLSPEGAEVEGLPCLAQDLVHRVSVARGDLIDDPNYGDDLSAMIDDVVTPRRKAIIATSIDREFQKDERVLRSQTDGEFVAVSPGRFKFTAITQVTPANGSQPFVMTLDVTAENVTLIAAGSQPNR